jgi:hypothetical protein
MDIIVFGAGEEGKKAIPFLEKKYHILFLSDNNKEKQGAFIGNYMIKSPEEIKEHDSAVVIASTKYALEIENYLQNIGVRRERIYFCRRYSMDEYKIYPVMAERIENASFSLVQYDLYNTKEYETVCKKVMVFCIFYSTYTKQLIENMSKKYKDIEFSLLTKTEEYKEKIVSEKLKHIYCFQTIEDLKTILDQLPIYDAMQLLWIEPEWSYFCELIRKKTKRLNLNVGGSDFYRVGKEGRDFKRDLIAYADNITAETESTVQEFGEYYGEDAKNKTNLLPFGIEVLDWIDRIEKFPRNTIRKKYHIPFDKIVVTCGHNAIKEHQHMKIIDAVETMSDKVKSQLIFVFPMTYPQKADAYINSVRDRLKESGLDHVVLTNFMDFNEMAEYALVSDIMIHVQTTDQLSSTMLEEMYAGSIVLAGKWLPYQSLHKKGMFFLDVDEICDITMILEDVVENIEKYRTKCEGNKVIVRKHSSWDELASKWYALWN